jgi:hypothetical protein
MMLFGVERDAVTLAGHAQRATIGAVPQSIPNPLRVKRHDSSRWPPRTRSLQPVEVLKGIMCKEDNPIVLLDEVLKEAVEKHLEVILPLHVLRLIEGKWDHLAEVLDVFDNEVPRLDDWSFPTVLRSKLNVGQAKLNYVSEVAAAIRKLGIDSHKRNVRRCTGFPGKGQQAQLAVSVHVLGVESLHNDDGQ